ncbi:MAG: hypothetical protein F4142_02255 [Nitrospira sp. SB0675_bin_23]|nr:hypothetical protein [Nitrospira sp. SB0667_bin_9]MYD31670.1 hypothetical protein [Nitrospira sp. SB0661_bin_20]MYH01412.1 hypothetical protein [Nitrospira sp. SB0675_bin_23]MYJ23296.1 hypothetical protein [Nitrospira sp. SB0673_bin_12]
MLKHMNHLMFLRCFVVLAFIFILVPLHSNDAYADDDGLVNGLLWGVGGVVFAILYTALGVGGDEDTVSENNDKEKVLAEKLAKLNANENSLTYPVFEW